MTGTSLINFGEISKPATVLIEKISDALGGYFKPYQIKRVASAEAEAEIIKAQTQIDITDLQQRAFIRFIGEEAMKQQNIEQITEKAIIQLTTDSIPEAIEDDWITNYFDKCRIVSDEEMQLLWSKVLSGEANQPGKYSKRTVNYLSSLDKTDATLFCKLCSFGCFFEEILPIIHYRDEFYKQNDISFDLLRHLNDIGLISFNWVTGFSKIGLPKQIVISYYGTPLNIKFTKETDNVLKIGNILLTQTGEQLAGICNSEPIPGFMDYLRDKLTKDGLIVS